MFEKYKIKIQDVPKIRQDNFWQIWFDTDLSKLKDPKDEDKQEIIYDICKTLIQLELPKSMIKKLTDNINIKLLWNISLAVIYKILSKKEENYVKKLLKFYLDK